MTPIAKLAVSLAIKRRVAMVAVALLALAATPAIAAEPAKRDPGMPKVETQTEAAASTADLMAMADAMATAEMPRRNTLFWRLREARKDRD